MAGATYVETLDAFTDFVTAYVHTLLYLRSLYPRTSFVHSRFHNTSAYQSRHPLVCDWIRDAVNAVRAELLDGTVSRISIVIFHYGDGSESGSEERGTGDVQILERFMIDVPAIPVVDEDERNTVLERRSTPSSQVSVGTASLEPGGISGEDDGERCHVESGAGPTGADTSSRRNRSRKGSESNEPVLDIGVDTNLAEQMRAALILLAIRCAQLKPLPDKCSFIIATELKDDVDLEPSVGHPQAWISVQPSLPKTGREAFSHAKVEAVGADGSMQENNKLEDKRKRGEDLGALRFTPIRTVEAGTFKFETWIEERTGEVRCS
ncbi:hypothetical protein E8E12_000793 [Didymella heteroderae]|uniref:HORMA domain-containing protein n=1 Tax=Didymella heteroderae TaxID=1769908 RepID=A0A9P4WFW2_9PLEO|nr:hypothetical protein E8E12_000793 [Didymella heteroderae]